MDVIEARAKLAEKFGESTRIGGKGVARRKVYFNKTRKKQLLNLHPQMILNNLKVSLNLKKIIPY